MNVLVGYIADKDPDPEVIDPLHTLASHAYSQLQGVWHEGGVR